MRAVMLVALVSACGGSAASPVHATAPLGFADPTTIRGLLATYDPAAHARLTTYEALPTHFELPEGPYDVSNTDLFDGYLGDGAQDRLVTVTVTAVHEMTHAYGSRMAWQLLAERQQSYGDGALAVLVDAEPTLVRFTPTFPSGELDATFPDDARTHRYAEYIAGNVTPELATQSRGVYGLLDEYAASFQDARTAVAFWPWVRDVAPPDWRVVMNYAVLLDDLQRGYVDFTLYLLHYLVHARAHDAEVYDALVGNPEFRAAVVAVHDGYAALDAQVRAELVPEVHAFGRTRGVVLEARASQLLIDGHPQRADEAAAVRAARLHLDDDAYVDALDALR